MKLIDRVKKKVEQVGAKQTRHLIIQKLYRYFVLYVLMAFTRKNKLLKNNYNYLKSYRYINLKYKKVLKKMPKYEGTNEYSNKVWWCWFQGVENAPDIQKACLKSLQEQLKDTDREIVVITEDNMFDYVEFPDYILEKYNKGIISKTHFSDLLRLELLLRHGGTWIDSTTYCTNYQEDLFDIPLFMYKAVKRGNDTILADNWFITAEKNNPVLRTVRDLLYLYWKQHNYVMDYFIFQLIFTMVCKEKYFQEFVNIPGWSNTAALMMNYELFSKYSPERFEQLSRMSSFHKLTHKLDPIPEDKYTMYDYIVRDVTKNKKEYKDNKTSNKDNKNTNKGKKKK